MNEELIRYISEGVGARLERTIKRLWILCIILIFALIISNACWIYYENQWKYVETSEVITQDGYGMNIISGGDTNYGTESSEGN